MAKIENRVVSFKLVSKQVIIVVFMTCDRYFMHVCLALAWYGGIGSTIHERVYERVYRYRSCSLSSLVAENCNDMESFATWLQNLMTRRSQPPDKLHSLHHSCCDVFVGLSKGLCITQNYQFELFH
jgi:hypothetical protein